MDIQYDPALMESVVLLEIEQREKEGDLTFFKEYHDLVDPIYEIASLEERNKAFQRVYQKLFFSWGLETVLVEVIHEFPWFEDYIALIYFKKISSRDDTGADLMAKKGGVNPKVVLVQLLPQYFVERAWLKNFLRHEFMHISDILDNAFQYQESPIMDSLPDNWVRERYRVIWDTYIDGRLSRKGFALVKGKDERWQEFESLYRKVPNLQRRALFEWLWEVKSLTHKEILESAENTVNFLKIAEISWSGYESLDKKSFFPGMPCPLCHFPTYYWEEEALLNLEESVIKLIQEDYPEWTVEDGACPRCLERYRMVIEAVEIK
jgi:hypothetical protein